MYEQALGCLYGEALGDAWAMPALHSPAATWEHFGGWIDDFARPPEGHPVHAGLAPARVTDDTEQAFALAEAIIQDGGVTVAGTARAIVAWYDRVGGDACPFVGPSTRRAVQLLRRGADPYTTGGGGETNGAAMRIAPVGLIHPDDVPGAAAAAAVACIPTHNTEVAISAAAAVAGAIAYALHPRAGLAGILEAGQEAAEIGRRFGGRSIAPAVARRIELAARLAGAPLPERQRLQDIYDLVGASMLACESVPAAFGVLVMSGGDPRRAAVYAAGLSGDADTVGAIACAIAGAWRGVGAFAPAHLARLRAANPGLAFERVAAGLAALQPAPPDGRS